MASDTSDTSATEAAALALAGPRSGMDEVSYEAGSPNVLKMTKRLPHVAPPGTLAPPGGAGERSGWSRSDGEAGTVLALRGVLDAVTVADVRPVAEAVVAERCRRVVVDCASLQMIDSTGVGLIVSLYKQARAFGGTVKVTRLDGQPLAVFKLLRLDGILAAG